MADQPRQTPPSNPLLGVISIDPDRMHGTPVFAGTRVPISHLFDYGAGGDPLSTFLHDSPGVTAEQARMVLQAASESPLNPLDPAHPRESRDADSRT